MLTTNKNKTQDTRHKTQEKRFFGFGFYFLKFNLCLVSCVLCLFCVLAHAQDPSVVAEVDSRTIDLQSAVTFTLTVKGAESPAGLELPPIDGFDMQYRGPSRQISFINGQMSSSTSFVYTLFPKKEGTFTIPKLSLTVGGQTITTQPITIEVVGAGQPSAAGSSSDQGAGLNDKIFLVLKTPQSEVYVNQKVPVKIFLFVNGIQVRDIQYPQLNDVGTKLGEFVKPAQYQQVVNGVRYDVVEFNTYLYPTRAGTLELGPATLDCNILYQNQGGPGGMNSIFEDEFFGAFFGQSVERRQVKVKSPVQSLVVKPLPEEGKPADFSGAVGQFIFSADVGPSEVQAGDPITLKMKLTGEGNVAAASFPKLADDSNFKLYDPSIKDEGGSKTFEQVVIPLNDQVKEIPQLSFSYFDPDLKTYRTLSQGPFSVLVKPAPPAVASLVSQDQAPTVAPTARPEVVGSDIVYLKEEIGDLHPKGKVFYWHPLYIIFVLALVGGWIGFHIYHGHISRFQSDHRFARRMLAPRQAKENIKRISQMDAAADREFYDLIYQTLQGYLADKLLIPAGAVSYETVVNQAPLASLDQTCRTGLRKLFDVCDAVRFAGVKIPQDQRREDFRWLQQFIDHCERMTR